MFFEATRHFTLRVEPDGVHDLMFMPVFIVRYECLVVILYLHLNCP